MNLKTAALLAFLGSLLLAIVNVWDFVSSMVNLGGGLVPLKTVILAAISAFAAVTYTIFFYVFQSRN
jgi:hypothetical protein